MFSADIETSYVRHVEEKDYSLSLSYYQSVQETVRLSIAGAGMDALNDAGKSIYMNGTNKFFNMACGDQYITSFKRGGLLVMNLNVAFKSHEEKTKFTAHAGGSFGSIFSASAKVAKAASDLKISGSVSISAFQKGGNPVQLAHFLNKDSSGVKIWCNSNHTPQRCAEFEGCVS